MTPIGFDVWRASVCRLIRSSIYPELEDHVSVANYPAEVPGMAKTLFFFDHDHQERGLQDAKSKSNEFEALFAIELALYLLKQDCFKSGFVVLLGVLLSNLPL